MAASDAESVDADDDVDDDDGGEIATVDVTKMTEAERRKWQKSLRKWKLFVDFLVRHVAIVTYKFNCFERDESMNFMMALERSENLLAQTKLKKGETNKISTIKRMKEATDLLTKSNQISDANRILKYIDLVGRMRGLGTIAGGLYKALKRGKVPGLERIKNSLDFWKGFCVRTYSFTELAITNTNVEALSTLDRQFIVWPSLLRTSIHLAQTFLRQVCQSTGLEMVDMNDAHSMLKFMQAAEFIVATKMDEMLLSKVEQHSSEFYSQLVGSSVLGDPTTVPARKSAGPSDWLLPSSQDIDRSLLQPVLDNSIMLLLPDSPPKEKKKKKGRKGSKKGKKSGGGSASSHKGKKKKKKS